MGNSDESIPEFEKNSSGANLKLKTQQYRLKFEAKQNISLILMLLTMLYFNPGKVFNAEIWKGLKF